MADFRDEVRARLAGLDLEPVREAEIVEEIAQHLDERWEELVAGGTAPEEARRALVEELVSGGLAAQLSRVAPRARPAVAPGEPGPKNPLSGIAGDLRYGARQLRLNPGFALVAILSLALGTGANTAIFQLIDAVRLRTLPVKDPQRLAVVRIDGKAPRTGGFTGRNPDLTTALWERLRDRQQAFTQLGAWGSEGMNLNEGGEARRAEVLWVSGGFFETLGVRPALGRLIEPADDRRGCGTGGVVLSDSFWKREFGATESVLGKKLTLDGHPFTVMGVTPPGFSGIDVGVGFDVAVPVCAESATNPEKPRLQNPQGWWLAVIGRLRPGVTIAGATARLNTISPGLFKETLPPAYDATDAKGYLGFRLAAQPAATGVSSLRKRYESPLWLLMAIAGLVLLIACANLANLMLARASARQREMAVRLALGASRARVLRQLLAESFLLAAIGTVAGAALAQVLSRVLVSFLGTGRSRVFVDLSLDLRVLGFTALLALGACLLFGLAPAIQSARTQPGEALKASARGISGGRGRFGVRRVLVVSQVALSLVLLVGALLFVRTLRNLLSADAGFAREEVLVARVDFSPLGIPRERRVAFKEELLAKIRAIPGVAAASDVAIVPVSGSGWNENITVSGGESRVVANFNRVSPSYFATMGTALLAGRDLADRDRVGTPAVAVVTQTFAKKFLNDANPVGRAFSVVEEGGRLGRPIEIVGLVRDTKYTSLREEFTPVVFIPMAQEDEPDAGAEIVIRCRRPLDIVAAVRRTIAESSPAAVTSFRTLDAIVQEALLRERLMAHLSGFFGFLAAVLAMVGLYGVVSYMVTRRRGEIGVRVALGASRRDIVGLVLREAGGLVGTGLVLGAGLGLLLATTARSLLYGLEPGDPLTLALAASGLALVAGMASVVPARRAAGLDPVRALREE